MKYAIQGRIAEVAHTSFQVYLVTNEKGELSGKAELFDHNLNPLATMALTKEMLDPLVQYLDSAKAILIQTSGLVEIE